MKKYPTGLLLMIIYQVAYLLDMIWMKLMEKLLSIESVRQIKIR